MVASIKHIIIIIVSLFLWAAIMDKATLASIQFLVLAVSFAFVRSHRGNTERPKCKICAYLKIPKSENWLCDTNVLLGQFGIMKSGNNGRVHSFSSNMASNTDIKLMLDRNQWFLDGWADGQTDRLFFWGADILPCPLTKFCIVCWSCPGS